MMNKTTIQIYDTTLRDGSQSEGISYSVQDKLRIAAKLDELGVDFIEGGWPGSNPKDMAFFKEVKELKFKNAVVAAFGSTRRANISADKDKNLIELVKAKTEVVTIFGKTWDLHVRDALKTSLDENLRMIQDSVAYLVRKKRRVIYDAEHFFDGFKSNADYAMKTLLAAEEGGAEVLVLCDTNGGTIPSDIERVVRYVTDRTKTPLGIHTHNDGSLAVANALSAVQGGAVQVQGTINGCGERCGNPDLVSVICNLQLKMGYKALPSEKLTHLTDVSRFVAEVANMMIQDNQPYVGKSAFAHKGGVHINAVIKNPTTYEHITPESVGNVRRFLTSELSGKTNILQKAAALKVKLTKNSHRAKRILKKLQEMEEQGYQFEAAEASFELMIQKVLNKHRKYFDLIDYRVMVAPEEGHQLMSEATIRLKVGDIEEHTAAQGDGPVNALDRALRKALLPFYPNLRNMHLTDFKVRVLDQAGGTASKVRVFIESRSEEATWTTVGISGNIIEACWIALVDSVEYYLHRVESHKKRKKTA